jgi:hypothetical protein
MADTRATILTRARLYSQVPATLIGDTQAYTILDQEDRNLWNEISTSNPMLLATWADFTFSASQPYMAITSPAILRLVLVGLKETTTGSQFVFQYPLKYMEFQEIEARQLVQVSLPYNKFHWDGAKLHVRPIPSEALTLKIAYVPPITLGTGASGTVLGNVPYLQEFSEVLAIRMAIRLLQIQGRDLGQWPTVEQSRLKLAEVHIQKPQDAEPHHVINTDAYKEMRGDMNAGWGGTTEF